MIKNVIFDLGSVLINNDPSEYIKSLGFSIYLLTNYSVDGFAHLEASYDFIRETDGKIVSSHVHLCKPDKKIYELLLEKYDLKASECIFFDDNLANVLAAEELGIQAVLFTDIEEAVKMLESVS